VRPNDEDDMAGPTAEEQFYLELINESRLDPFGSAARYLTSYAPLTSSHDDIQDALDYFDVDGAALRAAFAGLAPVGPVAFNEALSSAATGHNAAMIAADEQSHQVAGEASLANRIAAVNYTGWTALGENVYAYALDPIYGHAGFMVDWGPGPDGMQSPAGHRNNIMSANFREVGIDVASEMNSATAVGPQVVTQDFGARGGKYFVLGVAYGDGDHDRFYSIGEGRGDLTIQSGAATAVSAASGGYTLGVGQGALAVSLSGGGLVGTLSVSATIATENLKLDVVDGNTLLTSGSIVVTGGTIAVLRGLGARGLSLSAGAGNQTIEGTRGDDTLAGGAGNDTLIGNGGADVAVFSGNHGDYRVTAESGGYRVVDLRAGTNDGSDLTSGITQFHFADGAAAAASLVVTPTPTPTPTPAASPGHDEFRMISSDGFAGALRGGGEIFGSNGFQDISILAGSGAIVLDGSFARGGDTIRLDGNAGAYAIALSGSAAVLTLGAMAITIPLGLTGAALVFDDGVRELAYDLASASAKIGAQSFGTTAVAVAAGADGTILSSAANANAGARLILVAGGDVAIAGKYEVFGSNGGEKLTVLAGEASLDGSFARGGDQVLLTGSADEFNAYLSGSQAVLLHADARIAIPVGTVGMAIAFDDGSSMLRYDAAAGKVLIGDQAITAVSSATASALSALASTAPLGMGLMSESHAFG
jgi:uncharacterized protein YkwD